MNERDKWWCGMVIALMMGLYIGLLIPQPVHQTMQAQPEAAPVFAAVLETPAPEENIFAQPAQTPGFAIEVLNIDVPQPGHPGIALRQMLPVLGFPVLSGLRQSCPGPLDHFCTVCHGLSLL